MSGQHPWLKYSPEKIKGKLDAVSFDAAGLWHAVQVYLGANGGDGTIDVGRLSLATARRLTAARCVPLVVELVGEGLMERLGDTRVAVVPWEQPPVEVWEDAVRRKRWQRANQLKRMGDLRDRVHARDRHLCRYCGVRVNWNDKKSRVGGTYDHVDPDGENTFDNVVIACRGCNGKKRDRTPEQAGMPLLRPGQTARPSAASAAHGQSPEPCARSPEPDVIQIRSGTDLDHAPDSARAPTRDRTDPNRIRNRSGTHQAADGGGSVAPLFGCGSDGGCELIAGCECPFVEGVVAGG